jgi:hypothetical protein
VSPERNRSGPSREELAAIMTGGIEIITSGIDQKIAFGTIASHANPENKFNLSSDIREHIKESEPSCPDS